MASKKPVIHGRDHLPGGADPIPRKIIDDAADRAMIWPFFQKLPIPGAGTDSGNWTFEMPASDPDQDWQDNILATYNGTSAYIGWVVAAGATGHIFRFTSRESAAVPGTVTLEIAGAYDFATIQSMAISAVPGGHWLAAGSLDLENPGVGTTERFYLRSMAELAGTSPGGTFSPDAAVSPFVRSTTIASDGALNGGPGYFWMKLTVTGTVSLAAAELVSGSSNFGGATFSPD